MKLTRWFIITLNIMLFSQVVFVLYAQENPGGFIEITGNILDEKTNEPLIFADIIIKGTNIASITNTEGSYSLKIPKNLAGESVLIQYLGYQESLIPIKELISNSNVFLKPSVTALNEVTIKAPKNAEILVRLMLNRRADNYFETATSMTGFYRETIKKRRQNASLAEAVVTIYKQPYNTGRRDAVELVKVRKSTNYSKLDTLALKLQGGPFSNLYADIMKYPEYIFNEYNLSEYIFSFEPTTQIDDRLVYVVKFKQVPELRMPRYYGKLYIDSKDYTLRSAIYSLNVENRKLASELFIKRKPNRVKVYPTEANYRVNYRVSNGKWYFSYSNILLTFKVNWKGRIFNSVYTLNSEMAITNWKPTELKYEKPKNKDLIIKPSTILIDAASGFTDPEFWGEYNIIEPEKSIESAIEKIQKQLDKS